MKKGKCLKIICHGWWPEVIFIRIFLRAAAAYRGSSSIIDIKCQLKGKFGSGGDPGYYWNFAVDWVQQDGIRFFKGEGCQG